MRSSSARRKERARPSCWPPSRHAWVNPCRAGPRRRRRRSLVRSVRLLVAALAVACLSACAARVVEPPVVVPAEPRYPELPFPDIPAAISTPDLEARHQSAWNALQQADFRRAEREFTALATP